MVLWKNCHALEQFSTVQNSYYVINKTFFILHFLIFSFLMVLMLTLLKEIELDNRSLMFLCFLYKGTIKYSSCMINVQMEL